MNKTKLTLFLILVLATLLRFYQLGKNPPGINLDEAAIGYNAYSILKTGRDEYGKFLPIVFRSYDDYKPPLYIYLTVPSIALFGENEFAVRFPGALLGALAVVAVFFLIGELFPKSTTAALFSSLLLAISPWHLQFTRAAYETGGTAFFTSLGLLFFLQGRRSRQIFLWSTGAIFFGLELYLYQASKVFIPLFVFFLLLLNIRSFRFQRLNFVLFSVLFGLFLLPVIFLSTTIAGQMRFQGTSVFQDFVPQSRNVAWRLVDSQAHDQPAASIFHPQILTYSQEITSGYLSHFRPDFLFIGNHGPPINYVPGVGLLYLWELPFVLLGIYFSWRRFRKAASVLSLWLLLAPLPAAVTSGVPSSIRTALFLPSYQIISVVGLMSFFNFIKNESRLLFVVAKSFFAVMFLYFFAHHLHMLFVHAPIDYSDVWFYGYKDVVATTSKLAKNYTKVVVSTNLQQPQNFFAFFLHYDPWTYIHVDGGTVSGGFRENRNHFSKYYFSLIDQDQIAKQSNILYVGLPKDFPYWAHPLRTFHHLNGAPSVIIVGT